MPATSEPDPKRRVNTSDAELNPKWQLLISVVLDAILGTLYGLWRGEVLFWLLLGTAVGVISGLFTWRRIALTRKYREREERGGKGR